MSLAAGPGRGGGSSTSKPLSSLPSELRLHVDQHVAYIQSLDTRRDEYAYWLTEHLRMNGLYWGLTALHTLRHPDALPRDEVLEFTISCLHLDGEDVGGFGPAPGHDAHMLSTVSAVQIVTTLDGWNKLEQKIPGGKDMIGKYIASLQETETGTFFGDRFGERDTRFLYGALNALSLMKLLHLVDVDKAAQYIELCRNADGGYGTSPGAESHSAQIFTCVAALAIAERLDLVDVDTLCGWLSERQITEGEGKGGLSGRPEKKEDVCYSWWTLSSLAILKRIHWIDREALVNFILKCQDPELGGFSDRPNNMVDVFHTHFALAGLSLLGFEGLEEIDPVYCMPRNITKSVTGK